MPPATNMPNPSIDTGHMLPEHNRNARKGGVGAWIGALIVVILLGFGALYFWGAYLNKKNSIDQLPFIPEEQST
ncbi:hypothetical protein HY414_00665 [Candidatus Kaiserbacteria bacterium]|nr:hypothetical protein [Candidatus Kaiserbacteria bacterium]